MEIIIRETQLKVFENGDIFRINKRMPDRGYVKCEQKIHPNGYKYVKIDGKNIFAHRIIAVPYLGLDLDDLTQIIDHWDRVKSNNNVLNLHIVCHQSNLFNIGAKHYCYDKSKNRWIVHFRIDGKHFTLGCFLTESEAIEKAKEVPKYQIMGVKYIKKEDVIVPEVAKSIIIKKDLTPNKQGKFRADKVINGTRHYIGLFDTSAEARFAMDNFTI